MTPLICLNPAETVPFFLWEGCRGRSFLFLVALVLGLTFDLVDRSLPCWHKIFHHAFLLLYAIGFWWSLHVFRLVAGTPGGHSYLVPFPETWHRTLLLGLGCAVACLGKSFFEMHRCDLPEVLHRSCCSLCASCFLYRSCCVLCHSCRLAFLVERRRRIGTDGLRRATNGCLGATWVCIRTVSCGTLGTACAF